MRSILFTTVPIVAVSGITVVHKADVTAPTVQSSRGQHSSIPESADCTACAVPHDHGKQVCASGCAVSNHPTPTLSADEFKKQIKALFTAETTTHQQALDTLLFYGPQTVARLNSLDINDPKITDTDIDLLRRELKRNRVDVNFRLIDQQRQVVARFESNNVMLDRRHEYMVHVAGIKPLKASGTIKRVGQHHLWSRL